MSSPSIMSCMSEPLTQSISNPALLSNVHGFMITVDRFKALLNAVKIIYHIWPRYGANQFCACFDLLTSEIHGLRFGRLPWPNGSSQRDTLNVDFIRHIKRFQMQCRYLKSMFITRSNVNGIHIWQSYEQNASKSSKITISTLFIFSCNF